MCVKAWKLHHSRNRMCKDAWIPTDRQTAALFVLDKVLLALQWSPTNQKASFGVQSEGKGMERDLGCLCQPWWSLAAPASALSHLSPEAQSSDSTDVQPSTGLPPSKEKVATGLMCQPATASCSLQKRQGCFFPALWSEAGWAFQHALFQLSKGFLLPCWGKPSILAHSQPDVKGLQPGVYNIFSKRPLRINNFYCNVQLHHALVKLD